jgi:predicted transcriptional regulator
MAATDILTLRLTSATSKRLARLSKATDRTRSRLAAEAIEKYLDDQAWQVDAIEEGVRAADSGDVVPQSAVESWVKSWGTPSEIKRPR